ncbi:hypothetical protein [Bacteroides sp. 224]|uniref:hypothetical protein n=1 Tax=Bacteroides sp. 224 TaxID=2302936 RepID=UPI0013D48511|nr:hypothetical protein [Bacteroides sp. 224]NDV66749.1 hypothetical protein [Bacteroides sp. 224]
MKQKIIYFVLLFLLIQPISLKAQEFYIDADLTSSYVWRGMKNANVSFQPTVGVDFKGFSFYAWGSTDLKSFSQELDFYLAYQYKRFQIEVADYFLFPGDEDEYANSKYFDYSARTTGHSFDAILSYTLSERLPLTLMWSTIFAGEDYYNENGKRSYSSYFELSYPFSFKEFDFNVEAGFTPWEGLYANKFNLVNVGLSIGKEVKITDRITIPVTGKVIVNPYEEKTHLVVAVSF